MDHEKFIQNHGDPIPSINEPIEATTSTINWFGIR
jgi:hypothetical protein